MSVTSHHWPAVVKQQGAQSAQRVAHPRREEGFSILELDRAGISEARAWALGLTIDGTRHHALRRNVERLKELAA